MRILGALFVWLVFGYALRCACGWQICQGEVRFIRDWLDNGKSSVPNSGRLHSYSRDMLTGKAGMEFARRYPNDGDPFIVVNRDRIGALAWLQLRRQRRLIDLTARRAGVAVLPIPFAPWRRADVTGGVFVMIHRRGRECVFRRAHSGQETYFLSGYDRNERPALYFLTQLPRPVTSIADARQSLKPLSVVLAERQGRRVRRQGDIFAVSTRFTDDDIIAAGGTIWTRGGTVDCRDSPAKLYGTAHTATRVASLPSGVQLAWGTLRHKPYLIGEHRDPDHHPLKLKHDTWHLVVKNTTPMQLPAGEEG